MTNGEKFKEIFPSVQITECESYIQVMGENYEFNNTYPLEWWNAEYKEPTTQERQAESDKFDAAFQDGYDNGYAQARFDYEQEPTTKNNLAHNLCDSCSNIGCEFQSGIVRTECAFYMPPHIEPDNCGNYVDHLVPINVVERIIKSPRTKEQMLSVLNSLPPQEPNTKNDIADNNVGKIEPTTNNDLAVDCISREAVLNLFNKSDDYRWETTLIKKKIEKIPPITPQEPKWISVSERLPEANIYDGHGPVWKHEVLITGYLSFDDKKETFVNMAFAKDVRNKCVPNTNVIAWMPLPKAYREVEK